MNIVTRETWNALKRKVYYETAMDGNKLDGEKEVRLKIYKIDEDIALNENSIYSLMDRLMERDENTEGFVIIEGECLILNSFNNQDLYSDFYSIKSDGLTKTFEDRKNFNFAGIRAEITKHERRAWEGYLLTGDKLKYLDDVFEN